MTMEEVFIKLRELVVLLKEARIEYSDNDIDWTLINRAYSHCQQALDELEGTSYHLRKMKG